MGLLQQVKKTSAGRRPRRILLYGTHGIGKSTFGSCAPDPVFIQTEDGLQDVDASAFPLARNTADIFQAIEELSTQPHDFKTVILDSADWAERLIWKTVCEQGGKDSITDFGFGKGYGSAAAMFSTMLDGLATLGERCGMLVILLAHCQVEKFENPQTESYDRYTPKLHKSVNGMLQEWCDEVLFCGYKVLTKTSDEGFNKSRNIAFGGARTIYTTEKPSHMAKNRLSLPDEIPLAFSEYWRLVRERGADAVSVTPVSHVAVPNYGSAEEQLERMV